MHFSDTAEIVVSKRHVWSDMGGEAAVLSLINGVYYGLDSVGIRVWELIQQPQTFARLREVLLGEYDVDAQRLEADLRNFLTQLADQHLVEVGGLH